MADYTHPVEAVKVVLREGKDPRVERHDSLTLAAVDGVYNQLLFDLCASNVVIGLTLMGSYEPLLDIIGWQTSGVRRIVEHFITYVSAAGTFAGEPTSSVIADACAPGPGIESGGCSFVLEGWGRLRRCSDPRDLTDIGERFCMNQPIYDIAGEMIDNDEEWDMVRLMTAIVQDLQREIIVGNSATPGSQNGFQQLVDFGYVDPLTGDLCPAMDSVVVDWNGQEMCPDTGATGVTVNGVAIPDGYTIIDIIKDFIYLTLSRIRHSTLSGTPRIIAFLPTDFVRCLIQCYICWEVCDGDVERLDRFEVQQEHRRLRAEFGAGNMLTLNFDGYPLLVVPYDYSLYNPVTGFGDMYLITTDIGNTPVTRFQAKDMSNFLRGELVTDTGENIRSVNISDNNRVISWHVFDNLCFRNCIELQWRLYTRAPWANMRIVDVACALGGSFGSIRNMSDPQAANFVNAPLVAPYPVAPNLPPVVTNPGAQSSPEDIAIAPLQIVATDPQSEPLTYSATGLPAGLTIAAATGIISGTPTTQGVTAVIVTVTSQSGNSTQVVFPWTITA